MSSLRRIVVTGRVGQVVSALVERAAGAGDVEIVTLGRPELDLAAPETVAAAIEAAAPDAIVSAAAYTAVDQAETEEDAAMRVNGLSPGEIARAAVRLGVPLVHLSTDYVFDGSKEAPYVEGDAVSPLGAYGRSKLAGEAAVTAGTPDHAILRTAWVYGPSGRNFLKTMLRVAEGRDVVSVVDDQIGNPTSALDIADCVLAVTRGLLANPDPALRGIFHMTGTGRASWADFAERIFARSQALGGPFAQVKRIPSSDYPTPAKRPANSQLDCGRLQAVHGLRLPPWQDSTDAVVERILSQPAA